MCTSKSLPFNRFSNLGVGAEHLSGDCDWRSVFDALRCVNGPSIKLLYVTPEKIKASQDSSITIKIDNYIKIKIMTKKYI